MLITAVETDGSPICTWHFNGLMNADGVSEMAFALEVSGIQRYPDLSQSGIIADVDMEYLVGLNPGDKWSYNPPAIHTVPNSGIIYAQSGICT